ncbi:MAG: BadF/BadG/BcrA/BcrD ATPase family protein [Caldilineaceae bacterium]
MANGEWSSESAEHPVLLGVDGGGTYTRVVCTDLVGHILAQAQRGGANPSKNADAEQNVQGALVEALEKANCAPAQIAGLVAGIAGLDEAADMEWAERFTTLAGMSGKPVCVNDAVIAWAGALGLQPGIIVIAGTGCILFGVTENGRQIRNYDFHHYANATARDLTFKAVFRFLAGEDQEADQPLVAQLLKHFGVENRRALALHAAQNDLRDRRELMRLYGDAAPLITQAAEQGFPLATTVCDQAARELTQGVRLLGSLFERDSVPCALIGSVAQSTPIRERLTTTLTTSHNHRYQVRTALLPPEAGAILLARQQLGKPVTPELIANLQILS